jgi:hypothetical protein
VIYKEEIKFLRGEEFDRGIVIKNPNNELKFRNKLLTNMALNNKILHVGFVDHLPLIDKKIMDSNWLHNQLIQSSQKCVGIDINMEGVEYLQNKYKINNIYAFDILSDRLPVEIKDETFDFLFLPDVIEHIGNPVLFLTELKKKLPNVKKFVITTPNAFCYDNFKLTLVGKECINTDHRFWFTPYTLSKILTDSGYKLNSLLFVEHGKRLSRRTVFKNFIIKKIPQLRSTLVMEIE